MRLISIGSVLSVFVLAASSGCSDDRSHENTAPTGGVAAGPEIALEQNGGRLDACIRSALAGQTTVLDSFTCEGTPDGPPCSDGPAPDLTQLVALFPELRQLKLTGLCLSPRASWDSRPRVRQNVAPGWILGDTL